MPWVIVVVLWLAAAPAWGGPGQVLSVVRDGPEGYWVASVDESKEWIGRPAVLFACENGVAVSRVQFQGYSRYAGPHVFQLKVDGVPFGEEEPRFIEDSRVVGKQFWLREGPESFALTRLLLQSALGRKTRISNGYLYFEVDMGTKAFREEVWERLRACGGS